MNAHSRPGALLLMTVLVVGSVSLAVALSIALRGIGELQMGYSENQTLETLAIADGCAQEALIRISLDRTYSGGTLSVGDGSCTFTVTSQGTESTIAATATLDRWTRKFTVRTNRIKGHPSILNWEQDTQ